MISQAIFGMDFNITGKELGFFYSPEYNRTFNICWDISTSGVVKLNDRHSFKAGFALGSAGTVADIKGFAGGETALSVNIPLYIGFAYNYNSMPEYKYNTHSLPLMFSYKGKRVGTVLGINSRFSSFSGESTVFEPILIASVYVFLFKTDILQFKVEAANSNDFTYGNLGAYFLKLNNTFNLLKQLSLVNEIELHQSGSIALASNFYGVVYRGGVRFLW